METTLVILSAFCFYYPLAMLHDTARRYDNMCKAGLDASYTAQNNLDPAYGMLVNNGLPAGRNPLLGTGFHFLVILIAVAAPLIVFLSGTHFKWYTAIIIHAILLIISQFLVVGLQPGMTIYNLSQVRTRAFFAILLGIAFYIIGVYVI